MVGLSALSLVGNPVQCDCRLAWISRLVRDERTAVWGSCRHEPSPSDHLGLQGPSNEYVPLPVVSGYTMDQSDASCLDAASASKCFL